MSPKRFFAEVSKIYNFLRTKSYASSIRSTSRVERRRNSEERFKAGKFSTCDSYITVAVIYAEEKILPANSCFWKKKRNQIIIKRRTWDAFIDETNKSFWHRGERKLCPQFLQSKWNFSSTQPPLVMFVFLRMKMAIYKKKEKRRKAIACENMLLLVSSMCKGSNSTNDNHEGGRQEEGAIRSARQRFSTFPCHLY